LFYVKFKAKQKKRMKIKKGKSNKEGLPFISVAKKQMGSNDWLVHSVYSRDFIT